MTTDPGATKMGIACFIDGVLRARITVTGRDERLPHLGAKVLQSWDEGLSTGGSYDLVTERMHKRAGQSLFDKDLERVEACRLAIPGLLGRKGYTKTYNPTQWKGNTAKKIHHARVRAVLSPEELLLWDGASHDAKDAIAIGLFHLGRILRGGAAPGEKKSFSMASVPPPPPLRKT